METTTNKVESTRYEDQPTTRTKKKQMPSASYTITQMTEMIKKLKILKIISEKDAKELEEIRKRVKEAWIETI